MASFEAKSEHLEQALERKDTQTLTVSVHQLAGSSGSYGFDDISALCGEIEAMVDTDSIDLSTQEKIQQLIKLMRQKIKAVV